MAAKKPFKRPIRFDPDPLDVAFIDLTPKGKTFEPELVALIINESYQGCSLVISGKKPLIKKDQEIKIKVGRLSPLMARVVWMKKIESDLFRVGIQILE